MGNLPKNGNLPIETKGIPKIGWSNSQYRLQDLPVVGIATVFTLASIVCTYNHITVPLVFSGGICDSWIHCFLLKACLLQFKDYGYPSKPPLIIWGIWAALSAQFLSQNVHSRCFKGSYISNFVTLA